MAMEFMRSNLALVLMILNITVIILIFYYSFALSSGGVTILIIDSVAIFFLVLFFITFFLNDNECCSEDEKINKDFPIGSCFGVCTCCPPYRQCDMDYEKCCNCDMQCSGVDSLAGCCAMFIVMILFFVVASFVLLIICAIGLAGKHYVRVFSSFVLFVLDLAIAILSLLIIIKEVEIYAILILSLSLFTAIFNLASVLLPNVDCCSVLSYESELQDNTEDENTDYDPPQNTNTENNNQLNIQFKEYSTEEYPEKPYYENKV